jgi:periplasmic divalent cation tolerance protein
MKATGQVKIVLVTVGSLTDGRMIARTVVRKRLAACVNMILAPMVSIYRWKGKVTADQEHLLVIKTMAHRLPALEKEIRRLHRYDIPEILAMPVDGGLAEYLAWVRESVA